MIIVYYHFFFHLTYFSFPLLFFIFDYLITNLIFFSLKLFSSVIRSVVRSAIQSVVWSVIRSVVRSVVRSVIRSRFCRRRYLYASAFLSKTFANSLNMQKQ